MEKTSRVFAEVCELYQASNTSMGKWMWHNHTQWVASKAADLARKYGADPELTYCAALLHDLGDCKYERGHKSFDSWSTIKGRKILHHAGFEESSTAEVLEAIRTHACRKGELPTRIEGKVLATADGLWHIQTNFFALMCYMHRPEGAATYQDWQGWFVKKIERDFTVKISFDDEKAEAKANYDALINTFSATMLDASNI